MATRHYGRSTQLTCAAIRDQEFRDSKTQRLSATTLICHPLNVIISDVRARRGDPPTGDSVDPASAIPATTSDSAATGRHPALLNSLNVLTAAIRHELPSPATCSASSLNVADAATADPRIATAAHLRDATSYPVSGDQRRWRTLIPARRRR
jgi:hypothetical protein